jgi:hypothetical protein
LCEQLPSQIDPIQPPEPIAFGKVQGLHEQLVYLGKNTIMDYDPLFGRFWIYRYDRTVVNNTSPFVGPIASGAIEKGMAITYVADEQVRETKFKLQIREFFCLCLAWYFVEQLIIMDPATGMFAFFDMNRPVVDREAEVHKSQEQKENERVSNLLIKESYEIKTSSGNYGFGTLLQGEIGNFLFLGQLGQF